MPMKSVLVIIASSSRLGDGCGSGYARSEAERPDLGSLSGAEDEAVRLVARVLGQGSQAGGGTSRDGVPLAIDLDLQLALALNRDIGAARLVVERQVLAVLPRNPWPLPIAAGKVLGGRGHDAGAGAVGRAQRLHRLGQLLQRVDLPQLGLDRFLGRSVFALAEVGPGERAAEAPEKEAGP